MATINIKRIFSVKRTMYEGMYVSSL